MKLETLLIGVFAIVLLTSYADARKSSSSSRRTGSSSSSGSRHTSRTTSRPHAQSPSGTNSAPIGWNVPAKQNPVASAPSHDSIQKTSATNVQNSGQTWKPSGGYGSQNTPHSNNNPPPYNPSVGGYNPSVNGGYHPPAGGSQYPAGGNHYPAGGNHYPAGGNHYPAGGNQYPYGSQSHPPSYGQPSHNAPYNPSYNSHPSYGQNHGPPPPYTPYNPYAGHSSSPGAGYNPPVGHTPTTILVQSPGQSYSKPGIGQLAKEAFVYAGVSAGVNAAVNRILPGGISGHRNDYYPQNSGAPSNGVVPTVTHTQITYNNYYNNGTAMPAGQVNPQAPAGQPAAPGNPAAPVNPSAPVNPGVAANPAAPLNPAAPTVESDSAIPGVIPIEDIDKNKGTPTNQSPSGSASPSTDKPPVPLGEEANFPSPLGYFTTKSDIQTLTEELFTNDKNNAYKYITTNLQGKKMDDSVTDDASEPLFVVKDEAYEIPTIRSVLTLHDNYELDVKVKEIVTGEKREEEKNMIDQFMATDVMKATMKFLLTKGYVSDDEYEFKDSLKRIWFTQFKRTEGDAGSSGFETVFLAEKFNNETIGMHNWIYYAKQEAAKKLNYLGYIHEKKLGNNGAIVKVRSILDGAVQPVTTIFVGTSPELEMALYTVCFYTRPNYPCPVKLGGTEFVIIANAFSYFNKDIIVSAYPEI